MISYANSKLKTRLIVFSALLLWLPALAAKEKLWLSDITTGDCVAARITAKKTSQNQALDKLYCAKNDSPEKIKTCEKNLVDQKEFVFFTDRCGGNELDGSYFIGINGVEHTLKRIQGDGSKPPYLSGEFSGNAITVKIKTTRLIAQYTDKEEGEVTDASYKVSITLTKDSKKSRYKGVLSYGPGLN